MSGADNKSDLRKAYLKAYAQRAPLDVHCELSDDEAVLCGGIKIPRVPYETFVHLGEVLATSFPPQPWRNPWQRCPSCVAMLAIDIPPEAT